MKVTFKLVAATNINAFNELVTQHFADGWKFVANMPVTVTPHEDISGNGFQYSLAMLLEEETA